MASKQNTHSLETRVVQARIDDCVMPPTARLTYPRTELTGLKAENMSSSHSLSIVPSASLVSASLVSPSLVSASLSADPCRHLPAGGKMALNLIFEFFILIVSLWSII